MKPDADVPPEADATSPQTQANPDATQPDSDPAENLFSLSMVLSGTRCVLSYIVFPWVLPALGIASGVGLWLGVPISVIAIIFNIFSIRRFWNANHKYKWLATTLNLCMIALLTAMMLFDIYDLFR